MRAPPPGPSPCLDDDQAARRCQNFRLKFEDQSSCRAGPNPTCWLMTARRTALERAYELAKSGECVGVPEIRARLRAEGYPYSEVRDQLYGQTISKALRRLCIAALSG